MSEGPHETPHETLSVEQLAARVGMTVRTVRFYAGRGLIPPPRREGRNGYYGPDHIARLELVRELQGHGFTLAAIERYLEQIPAEATPEQVAMRRTILAPWQPELPERLTRDELVTRAGRDLSDDDLELLIALGIVEPTPEEDTFNIAPAHLAVGIGLIELGLPVEAAHDSRRIIADHSRVLAQELTALFKKQVWPHLKASGLGTDAMRAVEQFKPLTVAALVTEYESAIDEIKRDSVRRRS